MAKIIAISSSANKNVSDKLIQENISYKEAKRIADSMNEESLESNEWWYKSVSNSYTLWVYDENKDKRNKK